MTLEIHQLVGDDTFHSHGSAPVPDLRNTVLMGFRGSVAHGLYRDPSQPWAIDDVDLIGVVIPEPKYYIGLSQWGNRGTREIAEGKWDIVVYELRKFVGMLMNGNPNVVSTLWMRPPEYQVLTWPGIRLIKNRELFLSKKVYNAFMGYAYDQIHKMTSRDPAELREYLAVTYELKYRGQHPNHKGELFPYPEDSGLSTGELNNIASTSTEKLLARLRHFQKKGENLGYLGDKRKHLVLEHGYDAKNASHCIRLLRMCREFLSEGVFHVYRPEVGDAQELMDIKTGKWTLEQIKQEAERLRSECTTLYETSKLPEEPDREACERLVMGILREFV